MNPYSAFVAGYSELYHSGKKTTLGGLNPAAKPATSPDGPKALIFSPHPDDECIIGALALRLQRQQGWTIKNVAVTLGSNRERRSGRLAELRGACGYLHFGLIVPDPDGWDQVTLKGRQSGPEVWQQKVSKIAEIIRTENPSALFFPHADDWNGTHIGTHWLVMDALNQLGTAWNGFLVETEFWGQMARPNLMVEVAADQVADQVAGTSFHEGEVRRNPFHLRLPAWMQDNVRRGSELVGGQGETAPEFDFATLYRLRIWKTGTVCEALPSGKAVAEDEPLESLFDARIVAVPSGHEKA